MNDRQASDSWLCSQDENDKPSNASQHKRNQSEVEQGGLQGNPREVKRRQRIDAKQTKKNAHTLLSTSNPVLTTVVESHASSSEAKSKERDRLATIQAVNTQNLHTSMLQPDTVSGNIMWPFVV